MSSLRRALEIRRSGQINVTPKIAGELLDVDPYSLSAGAKAGQNLGTLCFFFSGGNMKISVNSIIKYLCGGRPLDEVMKEEEEA